MTEIRINRRFLGGFLILATPLSVMFVVAAVVMHAPWWSAFFILPVVFGCGRGIWMFVANPPAILVGDGSLEVRWPWFGPGVCVPFHAMRSVRICEYGTEESCGRFLEIGLTGVTPGLEPLLNTWTKRQTVKSARKYGDYEPPLEPFLILPFPRLRITDEELGAMIEREKMGVAAVPSRCLGEPEAA